MNKRVNVANVTITRARRGCVCSFHKGRLLSCWQIERSGSCVPAPRRLRSFPLYTSSPRRRSERRASKGGHRVQTHDTLGWAARRQRLALDTIWRRLPVSRQFPTPAPALQWLFDFGTTPRSARRWVATEPRTSPVTLLLCYGGSTSQRESPPITFCIAALNICIFHSMA